MISCSKCNTVCKRIKPETGSIVLIVWIVISFLLFGLESYLIVINLCFFVYIVYILISKPSTKFVCNECLKTK
jgi:hypothetical protein